MKYNETDPFDSMVEEMLWPTVQDEEYDPSFDDMHEDFTPEIMEDKVRKEDIGENQTECEQCGRPIFVGEYAIFSEDGDTWCSWGCYKIAYQKMIDKDRKMMQQLDEKD